MSDHISGTPTPEDQAAAELRDLWPRGLCAHELAIAFGRHAADAIRLRAEVARLTAERDVLRDLCRRVVEADDCDAPEASLMSLAALAVEIRAVCPDPEGGHP
jgi:hypothetical protein